MIRPNIHGGGRGLRPKGIYISTYITHTNTHTRTHTHTHKEWKIKHRNGEDYAMMNVIVCKVKIIKQRTRWIGPHLLCTNDEKLQVSQTSVRKAARVRSQEDTGLVFKYIL